MNIRIKDISDRMPAWDLSIIIDGVAHAVRPFTVADVEAAEQLSQAPLGASIAYVRALFINPPNLATLQFEDLISIVMAVKRYADERAIAAGQIAATPGNGCPRRPFMN